MLGAAEVAAFRADSAAADSAGEADSAVAAAGLAAAALRGAGEMSLSRLFRHLMLSNWQVRRAFPPAALARIEAAIAQSEIRHRGQIRFAVEHALDVASLLRGVSARERAVDVFSALRVWDTEHNSGVLIYLLLADRDVEIVADRGVHGRVDVDRWETICHEMERAFERGNFVQGVLDGIERVAELLAVHFPGGDRSRNELPDRPIVL